MHESRVNNNGCPFPSFVFAAGSCPDGWQRHQGACYHFSHDTEQWMVALVSRNKNSVFCMKNIKQKILSSKAAQA